MNIQQLMKQAQKMQKEISKKQEEFDAKDFEYEFQNGLIKILISGKLEIKKLTISKDLVDPDDCETLEDLVRNAINESIKNVTKHKDALMPKMPGSI